MKYLNHLNVEYPNRWIERGAVVTWPARSPDLTPNNFFMELYEGNGL